MKTNNFYRICVLLFMMSLSVSCVQDDDFNVPVPGDPIEPADELTANITIAEVKELFPGYTTEFVSDLILEAYVVSSDAYGNFYKEVYLQDHPSNPTAGIKLVLDKQDIFLTYNVGRKVFIKLKGLFIGEGKGDVLTIGQEFEGEITGISETAIPDFVVNSATVEPVIGKLMQFSEITDAHIGMYVTIPNTQVHIDEVGLPFVNPDDYFSTQRTLVSCEEGTSFILETSAYATFSQLILPEESGAVSGIVTRDYSGNTLLLVLNEAIGMLYWEARCDAETI